MKSLSFELLKNYFFILILFFISILGGNLALDFFLMKQSKTDIMETKSFLVDELKEKEHQDVKRFYEDSVLESPEIKNMFINLKFNHEILKEEKSENFDYNFSLGKISKIRNYFILNTDLNLLNKQKLRVQIVKDITVEKRIILLVKEISLIIYLLVIIISVFIERHFYSKIINQFNEIKEVTSKVNLGNFEINIEKEMFFKEFSIILDAYDKMLNRLNRQMKTQVEFVQNASHELRTPIHVISGYANLINRWGMDDKKILKESIVLIKDEVKNINSLIEKLMFLAKQDYLKLEKEKFSLKEMIEDINREMSIIYPNAKLFSKSKNIDFVSDIDLFKQLLRNLIKNGIVYSNEGTVTTNYYVKDSKLILVIEDNGVGMTSKEVKKVFEKFYRVDKSRSRELGGHGLGLAIVKTILEVLNGKIEVNSVPHKGTSIILKFDL